MIFASRVLLPALAGSKRTRTVTDRLWCVDSWLKYVRYINLNDSSEFKTYLWYSEKPFSARFNIVLARAKQLEHQFKHMSLSC